jgi:hypothetical protein
VVGGQQLVLISRIGRPRNIFGGWSAGCEGMRVGIQEVLNGRLVARAGILRHMLGLFVVQQVRILIKWATLVLERTLQFLVVGRVLLVHRHRRLCWERVLLVEVWEWLLVHKVHQRGEPIGQGNR